MKITTAPHPAAEFYDHNGTLVATGTEAISAFSALVDEQQIKRREALRKLSPAARRTYATYLRTGRLPEGRAAREARNDRPRGSRRSATRRSSERSGDSGSEDGEPSPARECAWCGEPIDHLNRDARHCSAKHRVYAQRERDRQNPERVAARATENGASGRSKPCRCNGHHILDETGVHCVKCGHDRGPDHGGRIYLRAQSAETRTRPKPEALV